MTLKIKDASAMEALGARLAKVCKPGSRIHLQGDLGAGKTTLVRGFLRALHHSGNVKSPTYTLIESYQLDPIVHHFDLYRLQGPEELEAIGLRDYLDGEAICLVEWPERGKPLLDDPDLTVQIILSGSEREVKLRAHGTFGEALLTEVS